MYWRWLGHIPIPHWPIRPSVCLSISQATAPSPSASLIHLSPSLSPSHPHPQYLTRTLALHLLSLSPPPSLSGKVLVARPRRLLIRIHSQRLRSEDALAGRMLSASLFRLGRRDKRPDKSTSLRFHTARHIHSSFNTKTRPLNVAAFTSLR